VIKCQQDLPTLEECPDHQVVGILALQVLLDHPVHHTEVQLEATLARLEVPLALRPQAWAQGHRWCHYRREDRVWVPWALLEAPKDLQGLPHTKQLKEDPNQRRKRRNLLIKSCPRR